MHSDSLDEKMKIIARKHFGVKTLRTKGNDDIDSYTVMVWEIKDALTEAYKAGKREAETSYRLVSSMKKLL